MSFLLHGRSGSFGVGFLFNVHVLVEYRKTKNIQIKVTEWNKFHILLLEKDHKIYIRVAKET
jgi:hypothetical protein